jgi:ankyrin repeat protein
MLSVLNLLIDAGADPMLQMDALGRSALHFAAAKGAENTANALLDLGLKPYQLDKQKNTPLHLAGEKNLCGILG